MNRTTLGLTLATALALGAASLPVVAPAFAEVIGQNVASLPVSAERIALLPAQERGAWTAYLQRSQAQMAADKAALAAERAGMSAAPAPPTPSENHVNMPLMRDAAWYGTAEARATADNIVSFQIPSGGWGKNQNRAGPARVRGQAYVIQEGAVDPNSGNLDTASDANWHYVGTLDNGATTTEMRFLARVAAQTPGHDGDGYRACFIKGVGYLLAAQYPNGGWPQVWPLEGGYHDAITYNDDAVSQAALLLDDIAEGRADYTFVPASLRTQAGAASAHAVAVILASQVVADGQRTIWPQQIDALTLAPSSARNYEMPSLASGETSDILLFLMRQPNPSPELKSAVRAGVAWLQAHGLHDQAWTMTPDGRLLVAQPGAPLIWSRYYSLTTGTPIFGDRDRTIHDNVADLSRERRNGYSWFGTNPQHALDAYDAWNRANP